MERELRDRPFGELVSTLAGQTATLVRHEIRLAQAELTEKGRHAGRGGGLLGGAGAVALLAAGVLAAAMVAGLAEAMPVWAAALIVAAVHAVIAAVLARVGRNRLRRATPAAPQQTVETLKEDWEWAKTRPESAGR
jgi:hypothetical protein